MKSKQIQQLLISFVSSAIKIVVFLWLAFFIYTKTIESYKFGYRIMTEEPMSVAPGRDVTVSVTEGKTPKDIGKMLYSKGLSRNQYLAWAQIMCSEYRTTIKSGTYTLNTSMTVEEMLSVMSGSSEEENEVEQ